MVSLKLFARVWNDFLFVWERVSYSKINKSNWKKRNLEYLLLKRKTKLYGGERERGGDERAEYWRRVEVVKFLDLLRI